MQYCLPVLSGVVAGLLCKAYFKTQMQKKIKDYQNDLIKSQEKIIELQALNEKLQKRVQEMEGYFSKDRIIMN